MFKTTEVYLSGGICGTTWMPQFKAGLPVKINARGPFGFMDRFNGPVSVARALETVIREKGGDFQDARFTTDTELVFVRKSVDGPGRYRTHVKRVPIGRIMDANYVDAEAYIGDFMGE